MQGSLVKGICIHGLPCNVQTMEVFAHRVNPSMQVNLKWLAPWPLLDSSPSLNLRQAANGATSASCGHNVFHVVTHSCTYKTEGKA